MKKIIAVALCIIMMVSMMSFNFAVSAEEYGLMSDVYVSPSGTDRATGLENDPCTLARAMTAVKDGGTIHISGTVVVPAGFSFNKAVTIVGSNKATDILDLSAMPEAFNLGADVAFDYVTLKFGSAHKMCANGFTLVVGANCATSGAVGIYGGAYQQSVLGDTNVTLLSGNYTEVYGGGYQGAIFGNTNVVVGGTANVHNSNSTEFVYHIFGGCYGSEVNGNTYVWVGGNANPDCTWTNHDSNLYYIFGGGYNCQINGSTTVVLADNAEANYIYGGMCGSNTTITNGSNVYITGGYSMSVNGGSLGCDQGAGYQETSKINIVMTDGEIQQLFGAGKDADFTGDVTIKLLDGEISRRVFGGCYNEYSITKGWLDDAYVNGTITLVIGDDADVSFAYNDGASSDHALSAQSRRSSVASSENGVVIFTSDTAKSNNALKTGTVAGGDACKSQYVDANVIPAGDANLDGEVTNADVLAVMQNIYSPEKYPLLVESIADVDGESGITSVDLLVIYQNIYNAN